MLFPRSSNNVFYSWQLCIRILPAFVILKSNNTKANFNYKVTMSIYMVIRVSENKSVNFTGKHWNS